MAGRFWEFQQLSDSWKGVNHMDQVPRAGKLYIGGVAALYREPDPLKEAGITHVVSAIDFDINDAKQLKDYKRLLVQADDVPDEDLLRHLPKTTEFIHEALRGGGSVFVHCAMGVSRSATVVCAYLMWKDRISYGVALAQLREGRKRTQPNPGFARQLEVWGDMIQKNGGWDEGIYREWVKRRGGVGEWAGKGKL